ncbi:MAG: LysE family translocator [Chitinophagaceae bacterium]|nr:LysE family translocator [Chitinophagaceae bacterium]
MDIQNFWMFALTGLLLNLTPGNDMIYVASRSTGQGIKAGIISALGIMGGCFVHIIAAVVGLSAIISRSALAFDLIKYLGAVYLIYLGIRSLLSKKRSVALNNITPLHSFTRIFWQGVITNTLNPKVALFFLAFLPQFININSNGTLWQILFLGSWFNVSGTVVNIMVALLFGKMGNWLSKAPCFIQWQERITGMVLVGLGIKVAITKSPS